MSRHRALNVALIALIVYLMAYFGPHLDETACIVGACGFIDLDETAEPFNGWDIIRLWSVLLLMAICAMGVVLIPIYFGLQRMGWLQ